MRVYGTAKLCNILFTRELAKRAPQLHANCFHPGVVRTGFGKNDNGIWKVMTTVEPPPPFARPRAALARSCGFALSDEAGELTGEYVQDERVLQPSGQARDEILAEGLWEHSAPTGRPAGARRGPPEGNRGGSDGKISRHGVHLPRSEVRWATGTVDPSRLWADGARYAIRSRRTHKAFGPDPVARDVLEELFELARWAPNHNLTDPWRFRVWGRDTRAAEGLAEELSPGSAASSIARRRSSSRRSCARATRPSRPTTCSRARSPPTWCCSPRTGADWPGTGAACRCWTRPRGREVLALDAAERPIGLLHLGRPRQEQRVPERAPVADFVELFALSNELRGLTRLAQSLGLPDELRRQREARLSRPAPRHRLLPAPARRPRGCGPRAWPHTAPRRPP